MRDMAEGFGDWQMGNDDGLLGIISAANIACGFHAGDYNIMGDVMTKAAASGVSVGAHPGFMICMALAGANFISQRPKLSG